MDKFRHFLKKIVSQPLTFFLAVGLVSGIIFVVTSPPGFGLDERAHFMRTYMIANGDFLPNRLGPDQHVGAYLPVNLVGFTGASTMNLLSSNPNTFFLHRHDADMSLYKPYFSEPFSNVKVDDHATDLQLLASYSYSPVGYLHMAFVTRVGEHLRIPMMYIMYAARLVNLLLYLLIAYIAISLIPRFKWMLVCVALLPTAIFQAAAISIDPLVNALSFVLFALAVKYWYSSAHKKNLPSLRDNLIIAVALIGIALTKAPYLALLPLFIFIPSDRFASRKMAYAWKAIWCAVSLIFAYGWVAVNRDITPSLVLLQPGPANIHEQVRYVIHHPLRFIAVFLWTQYESLDHTFASMLGLVGDRQIGLPNTLMYIFVALGAGLTGLFYRGEAWTKRTSRLFNGVLALSILGVVFLASLTLYVTFTPVGASTIQGVQGRYFIPILPLLLLLVLRLSPFTLEGDKKTALNIVRVSSVLFVGLTAALYYLTNF